MDINEMLLTWKTAVFEGHGTGVIAGLAIM
jgi:hypothetical protein